MPANEHALTDPHCQASPAPGELLAGTEPGWAAIAHSTFTSAAVGVPTAAMLAAADTGGEGLAKSSGQVGQVLADALTGGGNGSAIEAVLDAATAQGRAGHVAEALASDAPRRPAWDTAESAGSPEFVR